MKKQEASAQQWIELPFFVHSDFTAFAMIAVQIVKGGPCTEHTIII
jgi:hypothetical protein